MKQGFEMKAKTKEIWVFGGTIAGDGMKRKTVLEEDKGLKEAKKYARSIELYHLEEQISNGIGSIYGRVIE